MQMECLSYNYLGICQGDRELIFDTASSQDHKNTLLKHAGDNQNIRFDVVLVKKSG